MLSCWGVRRVYLVSKHPPLFADLVYLPGKRHKELPMWQRENALDFRANDIIPILKGERVTFKINFSVLNGG